MPDRDRDVRNGDSMQRAQPSLRPRINELRLAVYSRIKCV